MEIKIMSQEEAQNWSYDQWMGVTLLISILGTHTKTPTFYKNPRIIEKISLKFDDIQSIQDNHTLLSDDQCLQIRDFVLEHVDEVESIVIHCFAGVSRGAAIAFAVCHLLNLDDTWIWTSNRYYPNKYCVYKLNQILNLGLTDDEIESRYLFKEKAILDENVEFESYAILV